MTEPIKLPDISTPQFRTLLIRRLKNLYPGAEVIFENKHGSGICFRLFDGERNPISDRVQINRATPSTLQAANLRNLIDMRRARERS